MHLSLYYYLHNMIYALESVLLPLQHHTCTWVCIITSTTSYMHLSLYYYLRNMIYALESVLLPLQHYIFTWVCIIRSTISYMYLSLYYYLHNIICTWVYIITWRASHTLESTLLSPENHIVHPGNIITSSVEEHHDAAQMYLKITSCAWRGSSIISRWYYRSLHLDVQSGQ